MKPAMTLFQDFWGCVCAFVAFLEVNILVCRTYAFKRWMVFKKRLFLHFSYRSDDRGSTRWPNCDAFLQSVISQALNFDQELRHSK